MTAGYENNPKANAEAFAHGWFHTGDQGTMDAEGYIRITGRLKEIINRGGEKISPREVDEVLMDHPAVAQVVTFAMPHEKLGEDVAAAIVLREGQQASEREIRDFCAGRLADFKVPRKLVFLEEIPKGATGKLQRIGLAEKLGLTRLRGVRTHLPLILRCEPRSGEPRRIGCEAQRRVHPSPRGSRLAPLAPHHEGVGGPERPSVLHENLHLRRRRDRRA